MSLQQLTAIDAFCGAGGLSLGLAEAGFDVRLAFDADPIAVDTYRANIGDHALLLDARTIKPDELLERAGVGVGELGLLAGGPPCQGFSIQRPSNGDDSRNQLVLRFLDLIEGARPVAFLMENVPAIRSIRGQHLVTAVMDRTAQLGYACFLETLNAADYGVAQRRRRAFLIGVRMGLPLFEWPAKTHPTHLTVREAFVGLPSPPENGRPHADVPNHYREGKLSARNLERIKHVPPGGGREHLPKELQLACHQSGHRHLDTYGRLAWDEPSGTITARFDSFTRGRFAHPEEHRSMTLREGARLQGFPDSFVFLGNREEGARMIGNAVPPPLAAALGRSLRAVIDLD